MNKIDIAQIQNELQDDNCLITLHYGLPHSLGQPKSNSGREETAASAIISERPSFINKHARSASSQGRKEHKFLLLKRQASTTQILSLKDIKHHEKQRRGQ